MNIQTIDSKTYLQLLAIKDLTDSPHAISLMTSRVQKAISSLYPHLPIVVLKGSKVVNAQHNYNLLGYPDDDITQTNVYTKWVDEHNILRTQTTSLILEYLLKWRENPHPTIVVAPGMVYRRDVRDRWHCATPHQMDVWVLGVEASNDALLSAIRTITEQCIDQTPLTHSTSHPYTMSGQEINALWGQQELEIGEAGLVAHSLLDRLDISRSWGGLAMGWGLDRLVMVKKKLPDIRLLRDPLPSITQQMQNLNAWQSISRQPQASRQISILRDLESEEQLVEEILNIAEGNAHRVQEISIISATPATALPNIAQQRLGVKNSGQINLLVKIVWQDESQSLSREDVNAWTHDLYKRLHQGENWEYLPPK